MKKSTISLFILLPCFLYAMDSTKTISSLPEDLKSFGLSTSGVSVTRKRRTSVSDVYDNDKKVYEALKKEVSSKDHQALKHALNKK